MLFAATWTLGENVTERSAASKAADTWTSHTQAHVVGLKFDRLHIPSCLRYIGHFLFFFDRYIFCLFSLKSLASVQSL